MTEENAPTHAYLDAKERKQTTSLIKSLTSKYRKQDYLEAYLEVSGQNPELFQQTVTDEVRAQGTLENRPCYDKSSQVHKLKCGHHVFSPTVALCGSNCSTSSLAESDYAEFYCVLCVRDGLCRDRGQNPSRWHDLLLPVFWKQEAEAADVEEYAWITRKTEPVFIDSNNAILLPRIPEVIALVRAVELRREKTAIKGIESICSLGGHGPRVAEQVQDNFDDLLHNHKLLHYVDLFNLAAIAVYHALEYNLLGRGSYPEIAGHFGAPPDDGSHHIDYARAGAHSIMEHLVARQKIEEFVKKVPSKYRQNSHFNRNKVAIVARRIRARSMEKAPITGKERRECYNYIIAACIQQAMWQFRIRISMKEVCAVMGIEYDGWEKDEDAPTEKDNRIVHRAVQAKMSNGQTSRADFAETKIRRFVGMKDYKKQPKKPKDERQLKKEEIVEAQNDTEGIDAALAGL